MGARGFVGNILIAYIALQGVQYSRGIRFSPWLHFPPSLFFLFSFSGREFVFITNYYAYILTTKQEKKQKKKRKGKWIVYSKVQFGWVSGLLFDSGGMDLGLEFPVNIE